MIDGIIRDWNDGTLYLNHLEHFKNVHLHASLKLKSALSESQYAELLSCDVNFHSLIRMEQMLISTMQPYLFHLLDTAVSKISYNPSINVNSNEMAASYEQRLITAAPYVIERGIPETRSGFCIDPAWNSLSAYISYLDLWFDASKSPKIICRIPLETGKWIQQSTIFDTKVSPIGTVYLHSILSTIEKPMCHFTINLEDVYGMGREPRSNLIDFFRRVWDAVTSSDPSAEEERHFIIIEEAVQESIGFKRGEIITSVMNVLRRLETCYEDLEDEFYPLRIRQMIPFTDAGLYHNSVHINSFLNNESGSKRYLDHIHTMRVLLHVYPILHRNFSL